MAATTSGEKLVTRGKTPIASYIFICVFGARRVDRVIFVGRSNRSSSRCFGSSQRKKSYAAGIAWLPRGRRRRSRHVAICESGLRYPQILPENSLDDATIRRFQQPLIITSVSLVASSNSPGISSPLSAGDTPVRNDANDAGFDRAYVVSSFPTENISRVEQGSVVSTKLIAVTEIFVYPPTNDKIR